MKRIIYLSSLLIINSLLAISCANGKVENNEQRKPINYTVILDLSDRILLPEQFEKDFYLIERYFAAFEEKARLNIVLTAKDRFSIKIIPQKNSPLNIGKYEDLLHLYLDETKIQDKNNSLVELKKNISHILQNLKKEAQFGRVSKDYFGVDIWAYLHDNGLDLSKKEYDNNVLVLTDGYFDFESQAHVIRNKNLYTSTKFLNELPTNNWRQVANSKDYGLLPIKLDSKTKWVIAGVAGKKSNDIMQTEKITYFWEKWLKQSNVSSNPEVILNSSKTEMSSKLIQHLKN
jgi:hypothetical protein